MTEATFEDIVSDGPPDEQVHEEQGKLVIRLSGDVDLDHSARIRRLLLDQVEKGKDILVDLSAVDYIDSSGIASLVEALQAVRDAGHDLQLVAVSQQAMRVLRLARLDKVFSIHEDLADGLAGG